MELPRGTTLASAFYLRGHCLAVRGTPGTPPGQTTGMVVDTCWSNMVQREMKVFEV